MRVRTGKHVRRCPDLRQEADDLRQGCPPRGRSAPSTRRDREDGMAGPPRTPPAKVGGGLAVLVSAYDFLRGRSVSQICVAAFHRMGDPSPGREAVSRIRQRSADRHDRRTTVGCCPSSVHRSSSPARALSTKGGQPPNQRRSILRSAYEVLFLEWKLLSQEDFGDFLPGDRARD